MTSAELYQRARCVMPGGNSRLSVFYQPYPRYASHGEGKYLHDVDGNRYVDFVNNYMSLIHGHAHPAIVEAITKQAARGSILGMPTEAEIELAEHLCERVASVDKIRFCNSGSEAVIMAIKTARAFTNRQKVAKARGAYHGLYDYAEIGMNLDDDRYYPGLPDGVIADTVLFDFNNTEATVAALRKAGPELAAVVLDFAPPRMGYPEARHDYVAAIAEVAAEIGALLIVDEVASFRLGYGGAQDRYPVGPDLTAFGKIVGGGAPIGAWGGRSDVMAVLDPSQGTPVLGHAGTFNANPLTMVAGLAAMRLYTEEEVARLNAMGANARRGLQDALSGINLPVRVNGIGSFCQVALERGVGVATTADLALACMDRGVFIAHDGRIALSTAMDESDVDLLVSVIEDAVRQLAAEGRPEPA